MMDKGFMIHPEDKYNYQELKSQLKRSANVKLKCHTCSEPLFHIADVLDDVREWLNDYDFMDSK